ncbi:MAG: polysaccharide deacetylase family protein [Coriobacteriia bacterium]|nr:polysaccharide deacetylase family protein [Coriobacteriia bacterium]
MFIERPFRVHRMMYPGAEFRYSKDYKIAYLTFDDGPHPQITPWILDLLDSYHIKATFFCVGNKVEKFPEIYQMTQDRGHAIGNHSYRHPAGFRVDDDDYLDDVRKASKLIDSKLFRPPYGQLRKSQFNILKEEYRVVMWDIITRDYSKYMTADKVFKGVKKYTRNGSIIVFHDNELSEERMKGSLPRSLDWLIEQGYAFDVIT